MPLNVGPHWEGVLAELAPADPRAPFRGIHSLHSFSCFSQNKNSLEPTAVTTGNGGFARRLDRVFLGESIQQLLNLVVFIKINSVQITILGA